MSGRYIDADELLNDLQPLFVRNGNLKDEWMSYCVEKTIKEQPIADVVEVVREVVRGEWKECEIVQEHGDEPIIDEWQSARCSVCGKYHTTPYMYFFDHFNYCPNCVAKWERREDGNNC